MFKFLTDFGTYEDRKVARFESQDLLVSTAAVSDSEYPFETAVSHREYDGGSWIVVENYDSREEAQEGHKKWVDIMTSEFLPDALHDVSGADIAQFLDEACVGSWREKRREISEAEVKNVDV